jgi:hypothetical protein
VNSRNFFADPQKLEYDSSTGRLRLSPLRMKNTPGGCSAFGPAAP